MRAGYKPWEFYRLTFREAMGVVMAFNDNQRRDMQLVATLGAYMYNSSGFTEKEVSPSDLIPHAFSDTAGIPSKEWLEEQYRRHEEHWENGEKEDSSSNE